MKILVLVGSYRKNGNTDQITGLIKTALQNEAGQHNETMEIETVYLGHQEIKSCRGCRVCFDRGEDKCPLKDDLLEIKTKMKQVDGILVSSPVYVNDVSGIVKNWIDRLAHVCHRPEFAGKCAYLVTTVGSSPTDHAFRTLNLAMSTWGFHIVGQTGFKTGALMKPDEIFASYQAKTQKIAHNLFMAIHKRQFARPSFMSLMMFRIQQLSWMHAAQTKLDYQYWSGKGWTDPGLEFYIPHQADPIKVALARLTGTVIHRFVA